jgi:branched-chain amino acid transport system ATP-binding protein
MTTCTLRVNMLELRDVSASYGAVKALTQVSMKVEAGEIVTLIGANGAGKTTTLRCIVGLTPATSGEILFEGRPLGKTTTHRIAAKGISLVPEGRAIFSNLTVFENLEMGAYLQSTQNRKSDLEKVFDLFPRLQERIQQIAGTLSGGEQQMLAIARALMSRPRLLLLDEPSLGLAPIMVQTIFKAIDAINKTGTTILLVEQNAHLALARSHRAYVLETGHILIQGTSSDLLHDERVKEAYLGE